MTISYGNNRGLGVDLSDGLLEPPGAMPGAFSQECASQPFTPPEASTSYAAFALALGIDERVDCIPSGVKK